MSLCFISSNQESLISSKLLTKQQEQKRKDRENVNRDYRYLLLLGPEKKISACVFLYSHLNSQQKRAGEKSIAACPGLLCIFIWYSPINVATIHSSCLRSLLQFQWTLSHPSFVITLSPPHRAGLVTTVPMCQCGQTVICPRGQIITIIVPVHISWSFWRFKILIYCWIC